MPVKAKIIAGAEQLSELGIDYVEHGQIVNVEKDPSCDEFMYIDGLEPLGYLDIPIDFIELLPC